MRKWLILVHRYLGIVLSLLFVVWFASGIVMIYTGGMPTLTAEVRHKRLPALDLSQIRLTPSNAGQWGLLGNSVDRVVLLTVMGRPAYRFPGRDAITVFADTGEVLADVTAADAMSIAARFAGVGASEVVYDRLVERPDQWTIVVGRDLPAHKVHVNDEAGTEVYVSVQTAEVNVVTTRQTRALAWVGAIPHWLYFTPLRTNGLLWTRVVVWSSIVGCVLSLLGIALAFTQFRWTRPLRLATSIPYSGWMRWHYVSGAVFGVFTLTWVFSGLLSMEPFAWTQSQGLDLDQRVLAGGRLDLNAYPPVDADAWRAILAGRTAKELELIRLQDDPYYQVNTGDGNRPLLVAAKTLEVRTEPFSVESLVSRLSAAAESPIAETSVLTEYDSYYYARDGESPLPVVRIKFSDPDETWAYVDPQTSRLIGTLPRLGRLERWLFNGLHSLDFAFWYNRRPLWDIGMIALSIGGLASSGIGLFLGARRVWRATKRVRSPRPASI